MKSKVLERAMFASENKPDKINSGIMQGFDDEEPIVPKLESITEEEEYYEEPTELITPTEHVAFIDENGKPIPHGKTIKK